MVIIANVFNNIIIEKSPIRSSLLHLDYECDGEEGKKRKWRERERKIPLPLLHFVHALIGTLEVGIKSNVLCIHNNVGTI